ncbi:MAG: hypothetical protein PHX83_13275 [Acidobacteriia bacterium]|nr:hypothetical protein [Terriglobia bacterium]
MLHRRLLTLLILIWPVMGFAQTLSPHRSIAFSQIAAGGGYETLINLTNRGPNTFNGTLNFFQGSNQPWNPLVNGTAQSNVPLTLAPGATMTLDVTGSGGVGAGFGVVTPTGNSVSGLLEGTLTYYVKSGTGTVLDSVGVAPSNEMYVTTIPFDNFNTIALALANLNPVGILVHLKLYSATNQLVQSFDQPLQNMQQIPKFLTEIFPGINLTRGRLDIQSDNLFIGTALTVVGGQLSALPFIPAAKTYTFSLSGGPGPAGTGEACMWFDGTNVQGYARNLTQGGQPVDGTPNYFNGQFSGNTLLFYMTGQSGGQSYVQYFTINQFSISSQSLNGSWIAFLVSGGPSPASGNITFTATN